MPITIRIATNNYEMDVTIVGQKTTINQLERLRKD